MTPLVQRVRQLEKKFAGKDDKPKPEESTKATLGNELQDLPKSLPLFPELEAAMPNHLARSALFCVIKPGRRKMLDKSKIASRSEVTIEYSGKTLDMADNDVFLHALRLAQGQQTGAQIHFERASFLRDIGRVERGTSGYKWLEESLDRLATGTIFISTTRYKTVFRLINAYKMDKDTGEYWLSIDEGILKLFNNSEYGFIDMEARKRFARGMDLAKWLQNYVSSHKGGERHTISVENLFRWSGGGEGRLRDFKDRSLPKALDELKRQSIVQSPAIRKDGMATWIKA